MTRTELIERLEAAEGPSRELFEEAAIICGIAGTETALRFGTLLMHDAWEQAALMLVPEGWALALAITPDRSIAGLSKAVGQRAKPEGESQTPALAICIAALKAQGTGDE